MKKELDEKLCRDFPTLYAQRGLSPQQTAMCWGFPGDGWFDLIYRLSEDLVKIEPTLQAVQVKEKFGGLRFYIDSCPEDTWSAVQQRISEAEAESFRTCESCGAPGSVRGGGWVKTLCDKCDKK
jgi:hypothetical protein